MEGFNRDLIVRVSGMREGTSIMMAMMTEVYLHIRCDSNPQSLEDLIDTHLTCISTAEDKSENKYYIFEQYRGPGSRASSRVFM